MKWSRNISLFDLYLYKLKTATTFQFQYKKLSVVGSQLTKMGLSKEVKIINSPPTHSIPASAFLCNQPHP
jgi:hypothetical protein